MAMALPLCKQTYTQMDAEKDSSDHNSLFQTEQT